MVAEGTVLRVAGTVGDASGVRSLSVDGRALAVAADGSFSTEVPAGAGLGRVRVEAVDGSGARASETIAYVGGEFLPANEPLPSGASARLNRPALDLIEGSVAAEMAQFDLGQQLARVNPLFRASGSWGSVVVDATAGRFAAPQVDLDPKQGSLGATIALHDLRVEVRALARLGLAAGAVSGTISAGRVTIATDIAVAADPMGVLRAGVGTPSVAFEGFDFSMSSIPFVDQALRAGVEEEVRRAVRRAVREQAPPAIETDRAMNSVFFGSAQAPALSASTTEIVCQVPSGAAAGTQQVTVSTRGGTSNALSFTVDAQSGGPSITSLSPASGPVGTSVVIQGTGFQGPSVTFNGVAASVQAATSTWIDAVVPPGATSGLVVVRTSAGASNGVSFSVTSGQAVDQGSVGSKARDFLSAASYTRLFVEVDYVQGYAPDANALNLLRQRLDERCHKPGGITIQLGDAIPLPSTTRWRLSDIKALEARYRNAYASGNTAVIYYVYVNGGSEWDTSASQVLGLAYTGSSLCMFKDAVRVTKGNPRTRGAVEEAVLTHESGHLFGMVGLGVAPQSNHQDPQRTDHCVNTSCVMYWAVNTSVAPSQLSTIPDQFDAACIADMRAAGGK
jgi:hypothetical protein